MSDKTKTSLVGRVGSTIGICAVITASLLTFPNAILWMVASWLAWFTWKRKTTKFAWLPLITCVVILAVKGPYWSPGLIMLTLAMVFVAVQLEWQRRTNEPAGGMRDSFSVVLLWLLWATAVWESYNASHISHVIRLDFDRPVVCLGDSLTTGLTEKEAYPQYLQDRISLPVVNLGIPGITSQEALKQLPAVLKVNPQVVVIELGGHDYLRHLGRRATYDTLKTLITACQNAGADVLLVEIPRGFIDDPFFGIERQLAYELDVQLIPDTAIRQFVLRSSLFPISNWFGSESLSDDGLHPNQAGAKYLAETVGQTLERLYGPQIEKRPH